MQIWVDADACPRAVKDILYKVSFRTKTTITFVANRWLSLPDSVWLRMKVVGKGFDVADNVIVEELEKGDLVITADIPLASDVIDKGGHVLSPRGVFFTPETIRERLSVRNFMDELRESGVQTGGPSSFGAREKQNFANKLDRFLATGRTD